MIEGLDANVDPRIGAALRCPCADCVLKRAEDLKPADEARPMGLIDRIALIASAAFSKVKEAQ